jgi:hypothetical protein
VLTNFFSAREGENHRRINLRLNDFKAFHRGFVECWDDWVADAPRTWKVDGFLTQNAPVGITIRYGQNQPLLTAQEEDDERTNWQNDRDYQNIRQLTFSLATHIR